MQKYIYKIIRASVFQKSNTQLSLQTRLSRCETFWVIYCFLDYLPKCARQFYSGLPATMSQAIILSDYLQPYLGQLFLKLPATISQANILFTAWNHMSKIILYTTCNHMPGNYYLYNLQPYLRQVIFYTTCNHVSGNFSFDYLQPYLRIQ